MQTGPGHYYLLSIGYGGFMGQIVLSGDQEDRQGPKRYHGGGGGGTGFEQGKGYTCLSFCRLEAQFRQDQGITISYRLGMFFFG